MLPEEWHFFWKTLEKVSIFYIVSHLSETIWDFCKNFQARSSKWLSTHPKKLFEFFQEENKIFIIVFRSLWRTFPPGCQNCSLRVQTNFLVVSVLFSKRERPSSKTWTQLAEVLIKERTTWVDDIPFFLWKNGQKDLDVKKIGKFFLSLNIFRIMRKTISCN